MQKRKEVNFSHSGNIENSDRSKQTAKRKGGCGERCILPIERACVLDASNHTLLKIKETLYVDIEWDRCVRVFCDP